MWYEVVKELAVAVAAAVTAIAAWRGVNAWRAQLQGTEQFALARQVIRHCLEFKRTLEALRSPFMGGGEMENPPDDIQNRDVPGFAEYYNQWSGYKKRLDRMIDANNELLARMSHKFSRIERIRR